jgi:amidohydrolase
MLPSTLCRAVLPTVGYLLKSFQFVCFIGAASFVTSARGAPLHETLDLESKAIEARMIDWRRDIHQNPELGNREVRTSRIVAEHLKKLAYEVREKVAHTGVVATLKGGKPGPVVALRADMDALPVTEEVDLPFASKVKANWRGKETGVMHACGHDVHTAILMAAAEVFAKVRADLPGTVKLIFQPAEEGVPQGEEGGARLMLKEGAFENPKPDMAMGLHVVSTREVGKLSYRGGPSQAGGDNFRITIKGKQTHGAMPWRGVDPIVIGAQVVLALQTIQSRQVDVTTEPSVLTVGIFNGGNRANIIPESVELEGTLRTFSLETRNFIVKRVTETAEAIAKSAGGEAKVEWFDADHVVPLINNVNLTRQLASSLQRVAGIDNVFEIQRVMPYDDFAFFAQAVPGFYFNVGIASPGTPPGKAAPNHSPRFQVDEAGMITGLRALTHATVDYMTGSGK